MRKFVLSLALLSTISMGVSVVSCSSILEEKAPEQDVYKINKTSATITMGNELQLSITKNGTKVNNVTWSSSDTDLARVDSTGKVKAFFFTNTNQPVTITGKIDKDTSLKCELTINRRTDSIFTECYNSGKGGVSQSSEGHVIYMFVHAGIEALGTIYVTKTFEYDSYTNICNIMVKKEFTQDGVDAMYVGKNQFYWGQYKEGLFYGQYSEVYNGFQKNALFSFSNIGFDSSDHTIYVSSSTTYSVVESDWSTIQDESTVALGVFYRIEECAEYAESKFAEYNFGIHLF